MGALRRNGKSSRPTSGKSLSSRQDSQECMVPASGAASPGCGMTWASSGRSSRPAYGAAARRWSTRASGRRWQYPRDVTAASPWPSPLRGITRGSQTSRRRRPPTGGHALCGNVSRPTSRCSPPCAISFPWSSPPRSCPRSLTASTLQGTRAFGHWSCGPAFSSPAWWMPTTWRRLISIPRTCAGRPSAAATMWQRSAGGSTATSTAW